MPSKDALTGRLAAASDKHTRTTYPHVRIVRDQKGSYTRTAAQIHMAEVTQQGRVLMPTRG